MQDVWLFALASIALLATPGPTNTLLATAGALGGIRRAVPLLLGELAGYLITITLLLAALGPIISAQPLLATGLKLLVAGYVAWSALRLWQSRGALGSGAQQLVTIRQVLVTTLLNPKALVFAFSIFPPPSPELWRNYLAFVLIVPAVGFGWILFGRVVGLAMGPERAQLIQKIAALVLAAFAGLLAASTLHS
jgi:threonine/homoserine/homoserine lactone efflux protein